MHINMKLDANNQMNDVSFEVCDDVGVESPSLGNS